MGQTQSSTPPPSAPSTQSNPPSNPPIDPHTPQDHPHNFGRPSRPPHSEPHTNGDKRGAASKQVTDCGEQQRASLRCIEENYETRDRACAGYFEAYRECRRGEHERRLEENARSSGGQRHGFW